MNVIDRAFGSCRKMICLNIQAEASDPRDWDEAGPIQRHSFIGINLRSLREARANHRNKKK
jgi:hypothetical protein